MSKKQFRKRHETRPPSTCMNMPTDPIDELFARAVKDGRREAITDRWWYLVLVYEALTEGLAPCGWPAAECCAVALGELVHDPGIGDLTPRQYERLFVAVESLEAAICEFDDAYQPLTPSLANEPCDNA